MKLKYDRPKGTRINRGYIGVTTFDGWWWAGDKWVKRYCNHDQYLDCGILLSSHTPNQMIKSAKAFRRLLKRWSKYLPKGIEFILVSRYQGHDIRGTT